MSSITYADALLFSTQNINPQRVNSSGENSRHKSMNADSVEVSWDEQKQKWLIRIAVGGEVIRRHSEQPKDVDHVTLQTEAVDLAAAEGYAVRREGVSIA